MDLVGDDDEVCEAVDEGANGGEDEQEVDAVDVLPVCLMEPEVGRAVVSDDVDDDDRSPVDHAEPEVDLHILVSREGQVAKRDVGEDAGEETDHRGYGILLGFLLQGVR